MAEAVDIALPCERQSPGRARLELEPFREALGEVRFGDLRLLVSELVAEAIGELAGARSEAIRLRAGADRERVWAAVGEGTGGFLIPSTPPEPGELGWSVYLVQRLSDRWSLTRNEDGASVWFEISRA